MLTSEIQPNQRQPRKLKRAGLAVSALGLVVLLALAAQFAVAPADQGLLLTVTEAGLGVALSTVGFALMVIGADPFADEDAQPHRE